MRAIRRFLKRLTSRRNARQAEERLQAEIEDHLALQIDENLRAGLSPTEARRQAVLKFGAVEAIRESYRDQRGLPFLETLMQDTRHALRRLRNAPVFTVTTVLTLALGIGATTSIFTLVNAVLLKSLAVANPDQLYRLGKEARCCYYGGYSQDREFALVSYDLYNYFRDHTKGFSQLAAFPAGGSLFGVRRSGRPEPAQSLPGEFVSGNYFAMFQLKAYAGRTLVPNDDHPGAPPAAMMSYRLWQQEYGSDPAVVGSVFNLDEKPFTIVGITPPGFFGDTLRNAPPDFFVPLNTEPYIETDADLNKHDTHWLNLLGRVEPGVPATTVQAEMRVELKRWLRSHWSEMSPNERTKFPEQTLFLSPGGAGITSMRQEYEHWLEILMVVSGLVLLIVCANVANLMLVRGLERRRQTSLSMALGARPARLVRQALTESILLSLLGGAAGLLIAFAGTSLILHFAFPTISGRAGVPINASPSMPVLLFAFAVSLLTGLAFGIAPAWMATKVDPIDALRGANRSTARTGSRARQALVSLQAALALVLLSVSGLLTATLHQLQNQKLGFDPDRCIVASISPRLAGYRPQQLTTLYQRIHESLSSIPGVSGVALCNYSPLNGNNWGSTILIEGQPPPGPNDNNWASRDLVTAGYLDVIGNRMVVGRGITDQDIAASAHVAVINEAFARKFYAGKNPLGKHFGRDGQSARYLEIVGVAQDSRHLTSDLGKPVSPFFFLPAAAHQTDSDGSIYLSDIVMKTRPGATASAAQISQAMASVDPNLPLIAIRPLNDQVAAQFRQQRLLARLTSFFGILSLVLSSIGLYGVTAYNAGRRTNEIGVRMALGADRAQVVTLVLRGALGLIAFGLLIGLPLTFAAGRFLGSQLYGINPYDPAVTSIAVITLGLSALAASLIPAFRASLISPLEALRAE